MQALLVALMVLPALGATEASAAEAGANPIRRVVSMLQMMEKKITAEGKTEAELFEKFLDCYCKDSAATLGKSIGDGETKMPQLESSINEAESQKSQLEADLVSHKQSREDANGAMAKAKEIREKDAGAFAKESANDQSNLDALIGALAAIEKGMAGGFLQTNSAAVLRQLSVTLELTNVDRDQLSAFLSQGNGQHAPASGEIVGILKQMQDTMEKDLAEMLAQEEAAKQDFDGLMAAKEKEVEELTASIEEKTKRHGEVGVEIVNLKEDLDDTSEALMEDKKFLVDLEKNCATKQKEWDEIQKQRTLELGAIADTIKILSDDDALEMFKKALPSASLLQVQVSSKQVRDQALLALAGARHASGHRDVSLDFIALALRGKKVNFDKVIVMIDDMVALLGKEQVDDDGKKGYCEVEFDKSDDTKKALERSISDLEKVLEEDAGSVKVLEGEIEALNAGIHDLDKEVAGATEQRKSEHAEFSAMLASNAAASDIIDFAKNRLQKFYNPSFTRRPQRKSSPRRSASRRTWEASWRPTLQSLSSKSAALMTLMRQPHLQRPQAHTRRARLLVASWP